MEIFLFALTGYLIGSIPIAFLLTRKRTGIDLRRRGSGNIGARNAYEVTGNKRIGFAVLVLDMHKGIIPLVLLSKFDYCEFIPFVSVAIILGHCFPIWLRFHGGRGLATGAAIALMIFPHLLLLWMLTYLAMGFIRKHVHVQAVVASLACFLYELVSAAPTVLTEKLRMICGGDANDIHISALIILSLILSKHIEPVYKLLNKQSS